MRREPVTHQLNRVDDRDCPKCGLRMVPVHGHYECRAQGGCGYQDSCWVLDAAGDVPRTRESAAGMALVDAQLLAAMRRTIARDHVRFDLRPYRALTRPELEALDQAAARYGDYLQLKAKITLP